MEQIPFLHARRVAKAASSTASWLLVPTRRKWVMAALAAVAFAASYIWVSSLRREVQQSASEAATANAGVVVLEAARRADDVAVAKADTIQRAIEAQEEINSAETNKALARHPEWASEPVPADVLGSLRR